jgi:16S rRNA (guanine(1405)-N(7))-methyltransferase
MQDLDEIVTAVSSSKKYRTVCDDTIRRIAERELARRDGLKAAIKATKRRLHQVYGAFEQDLDYDAAYRQLAAAYSADSGERIRAACRQILALHSSTGERLPAIDRFYQAIWQATGRPGSLLDLGCGLNPLALPWMDLPAGARYVGLDIDTERIGFVNRFLVLAGLAPLARCQDVLFQPPGDEADVALLLKMSPSLERQEQGATIRLVESLQAPFAVVSFAVQSLGGREKGMVEHYRQQFLDWAASRRWSVEQLAFDAELVFVVTRRG